MTVAATAKRRRRQMAKRYTHLARMGRPIYPHSGGLNVHESIARERAKAARIAASSKKKK